MDNDSDLDELQNLVQQTAAYRMGICLLARHPVKDMGREKTINVWTSRPSNADWTANSDVGNRDLSLLLAIKLQQNWKGTINVCMAIDDEADRDSAEFYLADLSKLARLPKSSTVSLFAAPFGQAL